ncbi:DNA primase [Albimonas pacifica]|uniref:DNA primase n=1 Tax=Albimonas pacifica TaxID=1114924 RepID=A0A1I3HM63_9RHOB|nr:DNA primase [Albimonas pacifica]SFI36868.1 DNA primase [Albimonas pacifica]
MSLPPGFIDELRDRVSLASLVGRKVSWERGKTNAAKGDYWAPCPFHQEKTASFHVKDREGFYYCFGCQAKGDHITFLREAENLGFMEAVEALAQMAGMQMPARDPAEAKRAEAKRGLAEVMEQCVQHFRMQLRTAKAEHARAYLKTRGLGEAEQKRFEIGFAPDERGGLMEAMAAKGVDAEMLVRAGMLIRPEEGDRRGARPFDRFRGRIMFPIRDARGRCISFGGRALSPEARAKYLNGPETELFDKGRSLFNHGPAREAAGKGAALIAAEGYMDVIALVAAGFEGAVAPLGTAVTADQLQMLWKIADEPVVALDGDAAGLRAARRLADLALPLIGPGRSLRFALLPPGKDPDDLIRAEGAPAMQLVIDAALPLVEMLWRATTEGRDLDSPERRAALDRDLGLMLRRIEDRNLRRHYAEAMRERRDALFGRPATPRAEAGPVPDFAPDLAPDYAAAFAEDPGPDYGAYAPDPGYDLPPDDAPPQSGRQGRAFQGGGPASAGQGGPRQGGFQGGFQGRGGGRRFPRGGRGGGFAQGFAEGPSPEALASALAASAEAQSRIRESVILWGVLNHPEAAERHEDALREMPFTDPVLARLRDALLDALPEALETETPRAALSRAAEAKMNGDPRAALSAGPLALTRALGPEAASELAAAALTEAIHHHAGHLSAREEGKAAIAEISLDTVDEIAHRLAYVSREREEALRRGLGGEGGSAEGDDQLSQRLRAFIEREPWRKGPRRRN